MNKLVSAEFIEAARSNTHTPCGRLTFSQVSVNGQRLPQVVLRPSDFKSFEITMSCGESDKFTLGAAVVSELTMVIASSKVPVNADYRYVKAEMGYVVNGVEEYVTVANWFLVDPSSFETDGLYTTCKAYDAFNSPSMNKLQSSYLTQFYDIRGNKLNFSHIFNTNAFTTFSSPYFTSPLYLGDFYFHVNTDDCLGIVSGNTQGGYGRRIFGLAAMSLGGNVLCTTGCDHLASHKKGTPIPIFPQSAYYPGTTEVPDGVKFRGMEHAADNFEISVSDYRPKALKLVDNYENYITQIVAEITTDGEVETIAYPPNVPFGQALTIEQGLIDNETELIAVYGQMMLHNYYESILWETKIVDGHPVDIYVDAIPVVDLEVKTKGFPFIEPMDCLYFNPQQDSLDDVDLEALLKFRFCPSGHAWPMTVTHTFNGALTSTFKTNAEPTNVMSQTSTYDSGVSVSPIISTCVDWVVEQHLGGQDEWSWTKWASGKCEADKRQSSWTVNISNSWGAGLYETPDLRENLPSGLFTFVESCSPSVIKTSAGAMLETLNEATTTQTQSIYLVRPGSASNVEIQLCFHVVGRWK